MRNWSAGLVLILGALLILGGCGQRPGENGRPPAGAKKLKIVMIAKSSTNPVFLSSRRGAEDAAKELSKQHGAEITIDWRTPPEEDGQKQAQEITQAVNQGAGAILISCSDAGLVTGAINDAVARGVPVMTFDSDAAQSKRFAYYGVDDIETGAAVMKELAAALNGKGKVAILSGNQNAPNLQKRIEGVKQEAAKYPGIKLAGPFYLAKEEPAAAAQEVQNDNNANPDLNGWAFVGGWPLFTTVLLDDPKMKAMKTVSVDALPPQLPYVERGLCPVLLAQPCYKWGHESVKIIVDKVLLRKDVPVMNKMELVPVRKENLGQWARQLKAWGFEDVQQKYLDM